MLESIKEYDSKKKSVINDKTVAKMWAYTDYGETLNLIININEDDYKDNKDEIEDDIKYFIWLSFKDIVDNDIHVEKLHSEIPDFVDIDINTTIGVDAPYHNEHDEIGQIIEQEIIEQDTNGE